VALATKTLEGNLTKLFCHNFFLIILLFILQSHRRKRHSVSQLQKRCPIFSQCFGGSCPIPLAFQEPVEQQQEKVAVNFGENWISTRRGDWSWGGSRRRTYVNSSGFCAYSLEFEATAKCVTSFCSNAFATKYQEPMSIGMWRRWRQGGRQLTLNSGDVLSSFMFRHGIPCASIYKVTQQQNITWNLFLLLSYLLFGF